MATGRPKHKTCCPSRVCMTVLQQSLLEGDSDYKQKINLLPQPQSTSKIYHFSALKKICTQVQCISQHHIRVYTSHVIKQTKSNIGSVMQKILKREGHQLLLHVCAIAHPHLLKTYAKWRVLAPSAPPITMPVNIKYNIIYNSNTK